MTTYTRQGGILAEGSYSRIYTAVGEPSGTVIAYKKSRISLRVRRTMLRHEARVMQLLQGHPAIPHLLGYHRGIHFEYIGMELMGDDLSETIGDGEALRPGTVVRIGEQMISALEHLYAHKIIHRDVKRSNICVSLSDPSRVCLIDFGLARYLGADMDTVPKKLYKEDKTIIGTANWCSLNVHAGIDMRASDDLESLAYVLFFLFLGDVPWRIDYSCECEGRAIKIIHGLKREFIDSLPYSNTPIELSAILQLSRKPVGDWAASLASHREALGSLAASLGEKDGAPLDWTTVPALVEDTDGDPVAPDSDEELNPEEPNEEYSDSMMLYDRDLVYWDVHGARDKTLTFPAADAEYLDGQIPELGRIVDPSWGNRDI